jgi:uncharacterized delta-60 repeat protein
LIHPQIPNVTLRLALLGLALLVAPIVQARVNFAINSDGSRRADIAVHASGARWPRSVVARTSADGDLDPTFGIGGQQLFAHNPDAFPVSDTTLGGLAALANGAVQAAMRIADNPSIVILRLDARGTRDAVFGTNGRVELSTCVGSGDVAIATSGDAGAVIWTGECLIKLRANGTLDAAFGQQGIVTVGNGPVVMVMDSAHRTVLAGVDNSGLYAYRYLADGRFDSSFGSNGIARLDFAFAPGSKLRTLAIGPQGVITAGGSRIAANFTNFLLLWRLRDDGSPETTFGAGGVVDLPMQSFAEVDAVLPLDNGDVVVSGPAMFLGASCAFLARFAADGSLAQPFGLRFLLPPANELVLFKVFSFEARSVLALLPHDRILLGLTAFLSISSERRTDFTLMRFLPNGTLDTNFGGSGWRTYDMPDLNGHGLSESYDQLHAMLVVGGKVTLFGRTFFEGDPNRLDYLAFARVVLDDLFSDGFE